jgi:hypothetical protein
MSRGLVAYRGRQRSANSAVVRAVTPQVSRGLACSVSRGLARVSEHTLQPARNYPGEAIAEPNKTESRVMGCGVVYAMRQTAQNEKFFAVCPFPA